MPTKNNGLGKADILRHKKAISYLFEDKSALKLQSFPLKCILVENTIIRQEQLQVLFIVPSRVIRKAHDRNLIRRRIKEAYRVRKEEIQQLLGNQNQSNLGLLYTSNEVLSFDQIVKSLNKIIHDLAQKIK
jgi:ribonuclease P protein component